MTPFMMKTLAGRFVPIDFIAMMLSILNMIIVPIVAGIIANKILYSKSKWAHSAKIIGITAVACLAATILTMIFMDSIFQNLPEAFGKLKSGIIIGLLLVGSVSLAKLIVSIWLNGPENWMDKTLPVVSMAGIVIIIAIITSRSRDQLISVGVSLIIVSMLQVLIGFVLGYWGSRLARLNIRTARTVAIEVGLQNGGMASGLAINVLKSASAALAPAIFGPWMNMSGSILATWWHNNPPKDNSHKSNSLT